MRPRADSVAARLRFLRGSLGLSQEQLARRLGVSFATVNRWESGRTQLSPRALAAVAGLEAEVGRSDPLPGARSTFVGRERELAELKASAAATVSNPLRRTLPASTSEMLAKHGIGEGPVDVHTLDAALSGLSLEQRIAVKSQLLRAGAIT